MRFFDLTAVLIWKRIRTAAVFLKIECHRANIADGKVRLRGHWDDLAGSAGALTNSSSARPGRMGERAKSLIRENVLLFDKCQESSTASWRHRPARGRLSPLPRRKGAHKQRGERPVSARRVSRPCVRVVESRICPVRVRSCCRIWPISTVIPVALDHPRHPSGQPTFKVLPCWVQKDVMVRAELSDTIRGNDMPRSDLRAYRLRFGM